MTSSSSKSTAATTTAQQTAKGAKQPKKAATVDPPGGKPGKVVTLLKRPKGATITDLMKATDWQAHSVRGAISGAIKKKLKLSVVSEKTGSVHTYRIRG
jgi:hypothetical protein